MTSYSWLTLSVAVQIYNIVGRVVACRLVMRQRVARENLGCSHARGGWKICGSVTHRSNLLANEEDLRARLEGMTSEKGDGRRRRYSRRIMSSWRATVAENSRWNSFVGIQPAIHYNNGH